MLRTRERMRQLFAESRGGPRSQADSDLLIEQVNRVEQQALLLLRALLSIYVALGGFISATLITLLGAALAPFEGAGWFTALAALGLVLGAIGVGGMVVGCLHLFRSTRVSLVSLRQEAALVRNSQRGPAI
jgi:hypothetical protein